MLGTTIQHYKVGERLGGGGMGEVYLAQDVRLGRQVALKFLSPALKADPDSRARLLNEARAASLLRSPNIAVTYDIGEYGGADFIAMEYVEGELLSARVAKGPLPLRDVVEIGIQVAEALDEAHGRGIIHRDIKSANLIRTERGLVKVLDFGLAKFLPAGTRDDLATQPQVSIAGMIVGTISYMAPEQALGRVVDHRADLFSLGVVLYELATGRIPFGGGAVTEIIDKILHENPPPPSALNAAVSAPFDAIVARALEKSPTFRYQSARDLARDLAALEAGMDQAFRVSGSRAAAAIAAQQASAIERSVAVMTFVNISREAVDDWIGTGIAETVSSDLKNIHGLTVIGRARVYDALRNLGSNPSLDDSLAIDIGRRLGATWVVVGGFQRMGEMVRITAHFLDVATGTVRRTVKVDGRVGDIFALQDKIVFELSQGLNLVLRGTEIAGIERRETRSVEAYESYARGMMNLRLASRDSIERAIAAFEHATEHDPEYAIAWAALGGAYSLKGAFLSLSDLVEKAIDIERRALAIDPDLADAHMWLGSALLNLGTHRRGDCRHPRGRPARARQRPGAPGAGARLLGRQGGFRRGAAGVRARHRAEPRRRLLLPPARAAARLGGPLRARRGGLAPRRGSAGSIHLRQRRPAGRRRQRPARLRLLPPGALRRSAARIRARPVVRRLERSCAQGPDRHRDHRQDGGGLPPPGPLRGGHAPLRPGRPDVRQPHCQGGRRSLHALLHCRGARPGRRSRPRLRFPGTGGREAARPHRGPHAPRPRSPAAPRRSALRRAADAVRRGMTAAPSRCPSPR